MEDEQQETREDRQKRIEQNANAILIKGALENAHNLPKLLNMIPMLSPEVKERIESSINEFLPKVREFLPVIKDKLKTAIAEQSEKMGAGDGKIAYAFRNGAEGLEIWTLKNPRFGGEKVSVFSFKKITDRIDKYQKIEPLIGDLLSGKLFSDKDYIVDETPYINLTVTVTPEQSEGQKQLQPPTE